jgi:hypothetical protein
MPVSSVGAFPRGPSGVAVAGITGLTASYTIVAGDASKYFICSSGAFTITLPSAVTVGNGFSIWIRNLFQGTGPNGNITIATVSSQAIDNAGPTSIALLPGQEILLVSNGAQWYPLDWSKQPTLYATDITAGSVASQVFLLPLGYRKFHLSAAGVFGSAASQLSMTVSTDGGSTYKASNYGRGLIDNNAATTAAGFNSVTDTVGFLTTTVGLTASHGAQVEIDIWPGSSTYFPQWRASTGVFLAASGVFTNFVTQGANMASTTSITAIKLAMSSGNIVEGHFTLVGMA